MSKSLLPPALADRLSDPGALRAGVECVLIVLLAVQVARLAWLALVPPAPFGDLPMPAGAVSVSAPALAMVDVFHPRAASVPADTSGLRLFAVRAAGTRGGSAIIAGSEGRQASFAVGDAVQPGVVLAAVAADHVVLENDGVRRRLDFPAPSLAAAPVPATTLPAALPSTAPAPASAATAIDPRQLLAEAGLRPRSEGGRVTGYSVIPRGDGAVLRQAGLQAGDVLLSVNGQALTPERYRELADDLAGAQQITLTYQRGGETLTTTLQAGTP